MEHSQSHGLLFTPQMGERGTPKGRMEPGWRKLCLGPTLGGNGILEWLLWWELGVTWGNSSFVCVLATQG